MKLVIDVKKWLHGRRDSKNGKDSFLFRPRDGKQCCIGIYLSACGVSDKRLSGVREPHYKMKLPRHAKWLVSDDVEDLSRLIVLNDSKPIRSKIKRIFAKHDVQVKFKP